MQNQTANWMEQSPSSEVFIWSRSF